MAIQKNALIVFLFSIMACSCGPFMGTLITTQKKVEGSNGIDFANKVFIVNKVNTELPEDVAGHLHDYLINELHTMTDSVKEISHLNIRTNLENPDSVFTALNHLPSTAYLVQLNAGAQGGNSLVVGDHPLDNFAGIDLAIYHTKTREKIFHIYVKAEEQQLEEQSNALVFSRSSEKLLNRALKKATQHLHKNSTGLKKP